MARWLKLIALLAAGVLLTLGIAVPGAFMGITQGPPDVMIVENVSGAPIAGTVLVRSHHGQWTRGGTWFGWLGRVRTDLFLDPGPYSAEERRRWEWGTLSWRPIALVSEEVSAPAWVRSIALNHAGPKLAGWQARVAAFGWPRPVLYWLWDWRTESLQGGAVATIADPAAALPGAPARVGITGWNARPLKVPDYALPWKIIWSGLLIDLALFCAVIFGTALAWRTVRARRRRRAGRCVRCGYDVRGLAPGVVCPECGTLAKP